MNGSEIYQRLIGLIEERVLKPGDRLREADMGR